MHSLLQPQLLKSSVHIIVLETLLRSSLQNNVNFISHEGIKLPRLSNQSDLRIQKLMPGKIKASPNHLLVYLIMRIGAWIIMDHLF